MNKVFEKMQGGGNELVVIHTFTDKDVSEIIDVMPKNRFFRLLDSRTHIGYHKNGDSYVYHESLVMTVKKDLQSWGIYAKFKSCRPYYPNRKHDPRSIYWSGESPVRFVKHFLKSSDFKGEVSFIVKDGYGFINFPKGYDELPVLMGTLLFRLPDNSKCSYAFPKHVNRNDLREPNKFAEIPKAHRKHLKHALV